MAAGQGFKTFTTGEVLTAGDVNGYLMQGINVFATTTARDAAITAPAEGQFAFTKDNNSLWYYDGAAWVASGATGDIEGVTAGVGISGGGTSGTVTVTNSMATAIDAKGDLVPGTGADTFARLAVGANDTVLMADSSTATGLKWGTPASGGMTLITTTTWDNTVGTYTYSSLGSYKSIVFVGQNLQHSNAAASSEWNMRFNGSTGNDYGMSLMQMNGTSYSGTATANQGNKIILSVPAGSMMGASGGGANFDGDCIIQVPDYGSGQFKGAFWSGGSCQDGTRCMTVGTGHFSSTSAITSITLFMTTGNFKSGTMRVYGVS